MKTSTLIFDLGGVIINLDLDCTTKAFSKLTGLSSEKITSHYCTARVFQDFEKGIITCHEFRKGINHLFTTQLTNQQIDNAWNAMLLDLPVERLQYLHALRENYKVLILSNTNTIHEKAFNQIVLEVSDGATLDVFVDEVYFSHNLKMRKPNRDIYEEVLKLTGSKAEECLFLDDTLPNLERASLLGIHTMQVNTPEDIFNIKEYVEKK